MLPAAIVGSVVTSAGPTPFVLRVATGKVELGRCELPSPQQSNLARAVIANIARQVRAERPEAHEVRVGWFHCDGCQRWIDVARQPGKWATERCRACG